MAYRTGRSRPLTIGGTWMGVVKRDGAVVYNNGSVQATALGCSITTGEGTTAFVLPNVTITVPITLATPYGSSETDIVCTFNPDEGDTTAYGRIDLAGTWMIQADVEEWLDDTGISDPQGFVGGIIDAPLGRIHRHYEALKVGGNLHLHLVVTDPLGDGVSVTAASDTTITTATEINQSLEVAANTAPDFFGSPYDPSVDLWAENAWFGVTAGATYSKPYSESIGVTTDIGIPPHQYMAAEATTSGKIACRYIYDDTSSYGAASISATINPDKGADLEVRLQSMDAEHMTLLGSYPAPLTAQVFGIPGVSTLDFTGSLTQSITQRKWSASSTLGFTPMSSVNIDEFYPVALYLTPDSLAAAGEMGLQTRVLLHGRQYGAMSLAQARSYLVDDCSALSDTGTTPSGAARTGTWSAGAHTTASLVSGAIRAVVSGGAGSLTRTWGPANVFSGYRFLRLRIRSSGSANQPFTVSTTNLHGTKTWTKDRLGNALTTGADGTYVNADIDLCQPDSSDINDATDTRWPVLWTNDDGDLEGSVDGTYYGVTYVDSMAIGGLVDAKTYEIDRVDLVRLGATAADDGYSKFDCLPTFYPTQARTGPFSPLYYIQNYPLQAHAPHTNDSESTTTYYIRRGFLGNTDGRQSLELEDLSYSRFEGGESGITSYFPLLPSIAELVSKVNDTRSGPNTNIDTDPAPLEPVDTGVPHFPGWTASDLIALPGGDIPEDALADDWYYTSDQPAAWLGAQGLYWKPGAGETPHGWTSALDIDCTGGATIPTIPLYDSVDWYPGCGDIYRHGGSAPVYGEQVTLKAARVMRAGAHGLTLSTDHHPAASVSVAVERVSDSLAEGTGSSDAGGDYRTGADYAFGYTADPPDPDTGDVMYHPVEHYVTAAANASNRATVQMYPRHRYRSCFVILPAGGEWLSLDTSRANRHVRAFVQDGTIRMGIAANLFGTAWTDLDTAITGTRPCVRFDQYDSRQRIGLGYESSGAIVMRRTTDEGRTFDVAETIFTAGTFNTWATARSGARYHYCVHSGAIKGRVLDPHNNELIAEFTAISSGVDDDAIGASWFPVGQGSPRLMLTYRSSGAIITKTSPNGVTFS